MGDATYKHALVDIESYADSLMYEGEKFLKIKQAFIIARV